MIVTRYQALALGCLMILSTGLADHPAQAADMTCQMNESTGLWSCAPGADPSASTSCSWTGRTECSPDGNSLGAGCGLNEGCYCGPLFVDTPTVKIQRCRYWCIGCTGFPCPYPYYDAISEWTCKPLASSDSCAGNPVPSCGKSDPCVGSTDRCCGQEDVACCADPIKCGDPCTNN